MVDKLTQELFQTGSHYIYPISVYHCLKQSTGDRYHSSMDSSSFLAPKQLETITPMPEERIQNMHYMRDFFLALVLYFRLSGFPIFPWRKSLQLMK